MSVLQVSKRKCSASQWCAAGMLTAALPIGPGIFAGHCPSQAASLPMRQPALSEGPLLQGDAGVCAAH